MIIDKKYLNSAYKNVSHVLVLEVEALCMFAMDEAHVLFVALATHGHFNPGLQFATLLSRRGLHVTFATSDSVSRRLPKLPTSQRLSFAFFSDGYDDGYKPGEDVIHFLSEFQRRGSKAIKDIIASTANHGRRPFTFVIYSLLTPWMAEVARSFHLPSALFWNQAATVFDLYYHFFNGYQDEIRKTCSDPSGHIHLPGLPLLSTHELPSICGPGSANSLALGLFENHFQILKQETYQKILINTFDDLEHDALRAIANVNLIPVGPLVPSAFFDGEQPSNDVDISANMKSYIAWLNSKPKSSVVYVSFGSIAALSKPQLEELASGLLDSGRPFLWVLRKMANGREEDALSCREELEAQGKIVPWCSQLEILSNPATGCFLTHCGWNSCLESLVCGVPVVSFPQWTDQNTNAKIIRELSKSGMRLGMNEDDVVERREIRRCLDLVMSDGGEGEILRRNAAKWKEVAKKAATDGGSSDVNLRAFVDDVSNATSR